MIKINTLISAAGISVLLALSTPAFAADDSSKCMRCHKKNGEMFGVHSRIGKNGLSCTSCHGKQQKHPRDKTALRYFGSESHTPIIDQNKTCTRCHKANKLQAADWTHDVHNTKVSCADCHQLHPGKDPISGVNDIERSQLCADCHQKLSQASEDK